MNHPFTNDLIKESSPYLLQHAHNPVDWRPWNEKTLKKAVKENKLILVSIGYSACHWCHVMEHESFEDEAIAQLMNSNYINIKVDREERPDVDNVYMTAVQLMTGQGGWPLNVIALPDGRPVWGGTYFKKDEWVSALDQIANLFKESPEKLQEYAEKLSEGMQQTDLITPNMNEVLFKKKTLENAIAQWSRQWDTRQGGLNRAPKFMMPTNYKFLLRYGHQTNEKEILEYVHTTLESIAYGGINDHIGGGFARYSTDMKWHVPHFEKMLYDNAQLVSLYSQAYIQTKNNLYKEVVYNTINFIKREMSTPEGAFYSSLDADSLTKSGNLEEGAYYVWKIDELKLLLANDYPLFSTYYNINSYGHWEAGNYVLIKQDSDVDFAKAHEIPVEELKLKKNSWHKRLLRFRESNKAKPRLDDKILTSWNGLMLKGYLDAYSVFNEPEFLEAAQKNAFFIKEHLLRTDGGLYRTHKNGKSTINAYLEDYAAVIDAFITLYETTEETSWLELSKSLMDYTFKHFYSNSNLLFYFTSNQDPKLATRHIEFYDNVIPSSNSIMSQNLHKLSNYYPETNYKDIALNMLHHLQVNFHKSPTSFSNWMSLMLNFTNPYYLIIVVGINAKKIVKELNTYFLPNVIKAYTTSQSELSVFKNRFHKDKTLIYVCINNTCKLPVNTVEEVLEQLEF
ncbi:thioredoxin domain-containing protein [Dokdonia sp. Hel_I_53]|uniref:thioredoxin domain-containing protein n=1 Tax=Dokdonia sp. Hel_I_53 TaxID=1566287 RepID=UPI00119A5D71|nr:thioredoxin domain-containing protein [Dokdonia sp. Hel_I_53]TVZ52213.1 hypothetical protein OD90_1383 [Dokdonia sp. Hel_I_53]